MSALIPIVAAVVASLLVVWVGRKYAVHLRDKLRAHRAAGKPGTPWYAVGGEEEGNGVWSDTSGDGGGD